MKRILSFLFIFICITSSAQWRRQYVPASDNYPSEWNFIYESGDFAIDFAESGIMMVVSKVKNIKSTFDSKTICEISVYDKNGNLNSKGKYSLSVLPNKHAAGASGFKYILNQIRNLGATVKISVPLENGYLEITTTPIYLGKQVKFNFTQNEQ